MREVRCAEIIIPHAVSTELSVSRPALLGPLSVLELMCLIYIITSDECNAGVFKIVPIIHYELLYSQKTKSRILFSSHQ